MAVDVSELEDLAADALRLSRYADSEIGDLETRNAQQLRAEAQRRAPVLTGALRAGIVVRGSVVESTVDYGGILEYGSAYVTPQPYLNPAADRQTPRLELDAERTAVRLLERGL